MTRSPGTTGEPRACTLHLEKGLLAVDRKISATFTMKSQVDIYGVFAAGAAAPQTGTILETMEPSCIATTLPPQLLKMYLHEAMAILRKARCTLLRARLTAQFRGR